MIALTILTIILVFLVVVAIAALSIGGAFFTIIFADLIVCALVVVWLIRRIIRKKGS